MIDVATRAMKCQCASRSDIISFLKCVSVTFLLEPLVLRLNIGLEAAAVVRRQEEERRCVYISLVKVGDKHAGGCQCAFEKYDCG